MRNTDYELTSHETLIKLGQALYLHRELIKKAQKGREAVEYLEKMGVLGGVVKKRIK